MDAKIVAFLLEQEMKSAGKAPRERAKVSEVKLLEEAVRRLRVRRRQLRDEALAEVLPVRARPDRHAHGLERDSWHRVSDDELKHHVAGVDVLDHIDLCWH